MSMYSSCRADVYTSIRVHPYVIPIIDHCASALHVCQFRGFPVRLGYFETSSESAENVVYPMLQTHRYDGLL